MDWKKTGKALLFPPVWVLGLLTIAVGAGLIFVFTKGLELTIPAYLLYVLAFYTLTVDCIYASGALPGRFRRIREGIYANSFGSHYLTDRDFRSRMSLYSALGVNILYIGIQLIQWYLFRSWWFVVLAAYYAVLSLMRLLLARFVRKHDLDGSLVDQWKRSRTCAWILLLVNLVLSGAVLMILYQDRGFRYEGIMIYAMAAYTFYSLIHVIVDLIRYRRSSPILSTARIVSLSAALVSLLNLETAMFAQFGGDLSPGAQRIFIILTGAGVSISVVTLAVVLICRANKEIRSVPNGRT